MGSFVHDMFREIAPRYDAANDLISFGTHRLWRKYIGHEAKAHSPVTALDICTGTGDVVFELSRTVPSLKRIVGLDFVQEMVDLANYKLAKHQSTESDRQIQFIHGNGVKLPFADNSCDLVTISFGIRNIPDPALCLKEVARVLKEDGVLIILEFGQPHQKVFRAGYNLYLRNLLPKLGGLVTGNREAYEYLPDTANRFPCGERFCQLLTSVDFRNPQAKPLMFGAVYLYKAYVS